MNRTSLVAVVFILLCASLVSASQQAQELRVRIVAPENDTYVSGKVIIRAEIDQVGDTQVASATFKVDGAVVGVRQQAPWEIEWDAGDTFATHILDVEVVDATGREAAATIVTRDLETAVFRAEVAAVLLYVSAVDGQGHYLGDLKVDDFEVFEEGKR